MVFEIIAFISLVLLFGLREYLNHMERKDLLNRLMARNFEDYNNYTEKPEKNHFDEVDESLINLEEAREDIVSPGV